MKLCSDVKMWGFPLSFLNSELGFFFSPPLASPLLLKDLCDAEAKTQFSIDESSDCDTQMNVIKQ